MGKDFHIEEYHSLRNEIIENVRQLGELNKFLFIAVSVAVGWLLSQSGKLDPVTSFIGAWIPLFITMWFWTYKRNVIGAINSIGTYIKKLEEEFGQDGLGWERSKDADLEPASVFRKSKRFYMLIQVMAVIFAVYYVARFSFGVDGVLF